MSRLACLFALFTLMSSAAVAADAPSPANAPPPSEPDPSGYAPPPSLPIWAGAYIGGDLGYQWGAAGHDSIDNLTGASGREVTTHPAGVLGGAHVGYNWQMRAVVFGLEGDIDGAGVSGSGLSVLGTAVVKTHENIEGAIRARLGIDWNRALLFVSGGAAIASFQDSFTNVAIGGTDAFSNARIGWTVGGGLEYALTDNWSIRGEYRYSDYGSYNEVLSNSFGGRYTTPIHQTSNTALVGFSYKFSAFAPPSPVVMKY